MFIIIELISFIILAISVVFLESQIKKNTSVNCQSSQSLHLQSQHFLFVIDHGSICDTTENN